MKAKKIILQFICPDKAGVLSCATQFLFKREAFMTEVSSFSDHDTKKFFSRIAFEKEDGSDFDLGELENDFSAELKDFQVEGKFFNAEEPCKTVIAVSKEGHCLNDLIHRWKIGSLPIDITAVISNHETSKDLVEWNSIPFHFLPVTSDTKDKQEKLFKDIYQETKSELIILARYMQILSPEFLNNLDGDCINIHHSFLPGFKGAKPYHQAHERGVKIIGATSHYVTTDLDEGPIIEQDILRIDHSASPESMQESGYDIESAVLLRAVRLFSERRILLNGLKTVIFS
jgi:formyltetrahydrofolate deformylase|tara:strand:+ start:23756 stop:24616 length:861 start_codon:yes stop_codon:yes gene_type:complete